MGESSCPAETASSTSSAGSSKYAPAHSTPKRPGLDGPRLGTPATRGFYTIVNKAKITVPAQVHKSGTMALVDESKAQLGEVITVAEVVSHVGYHLGHPDLQRAFALQRSLVTGSAQTSRGDLAAPSELSQLEQLVGRHVVTPVSGPLSTQTLGEQRQSPPCYAAEDFDVIAACVRQRVPVLSAQMEKAGDQADGPQQRQLIDEFWRYFNINIQHVDGPSTPPTPTPSQIDADYSSSSNYSVLMEAHGGQIGGESARIYTETI